MLFRLKKINFIIDSTGNKKSRSKIVQERSLAEIEKLKKDLEIALEKVKKWKSKHESLKKQQGIFKQEILSMRTELELAKNEKSDNIKEMEVRKNKF